MSKILLNAGYLFPYDCGLWAQYHADTFKQAGINVVMPMGFQLAYDQAVMTIYYNACLAKGLLPGISCDDIGTVGSIPGWASRVVSQAPGQAALYPNMAGWILGTDIIVSSATSSGGPYPTTNDTYLANINAAINAQYAAKAGSILFDAFDGTGGNMTLYKSQLKGFIQAMDQGDHLVPLVYVDKSGAGDPTALIVAHAEACVEAGASYGSMVASPAGNDLPLIISELNAVAGYEGLIISYPDQLAQILPILNDYLDYVRIGGNAPGTVPVIGG